MTIKELLEIVRKAKEEVAALEAANGDPEEGMKIVEEVFSLTRKWLEEDKAKQAEGEV